MGTTYISNMLFFAHSRVVLFHNMASILECPYLPIPTQSQKMTGEKVKNYQLIPMINVI